MISDVDYSILATKLEALEHRIKKLEERSQPEYMRYQSDDPDAPYYREPYIKYDDILAVL